MSWNYNDRDELLEAAWGLIANANGGDWSKADMEWLQAAGNWRDGYHKLLAKERPPEALLNNPGQALATADDAKTKKEKS